MMPDAPADTDAIRGHLLPGQELFCLVTHFTQTSEDFPYIASKNHQAYAQRHGYGQKEFVGRISGEYFRYPEKGDETDIAGGGLYWQKIFAVKQTLDERLPGSELRRYGWVMWLDADIIITYQKRSLEQVLHQAFDTAGHSTPCAIHIVLSADAVGPVNAGAFFIRNTAEGRAFVDVVMAMHPLFKDTLLQDQPAITAAAFINVTQPGQADRVQVHPHVVVAPQRTFNSFVNLGPRYTVHPEHVAWQPGDFAAHYAGVNPFRRGLLMQKMLDDVRAISTS